MLRRTETLLPIYGSNFRFWKNGTVRDVVSKQVRKEKRGLYSLANRIGWGQDAAAHTRMLLLPCIFGAGAEIIRRCMSTFRLL